MFSVSLWLYLCELCNLHIAAGPRENILTWPVWGGNFWILLFEMAYCGVGLLCIFEWHWCPKHRGAQWKLFPSTSSLFPAKAIPKMTYTVSGGTLNPTHSLSTKEWHENQLQILRCLHLFIVMSCCGKASRSLFGLCLLMKNNSPTICEQTHTQWFETVKVKRLKVACSS